MKKLVTSLLLLGGSAVLFAQAPHLQTAGKASGIPSKSNDPSRVACAGDVSDYAEAKNIGERVRLIALQANQTTAIAAGSQYFPAPQPVTVSGLWVLGRKPNAGTINLKATIYEATADSLPGAALATGTLNYSTTNTDIGFVQINFSAPVTVTQPYIVAVENMTASPAFQICTNYFTNSGDTVSGRNEKLSKAKYGTNWLNPGLLFTGFDADFIIAPKVSYSNTADFTPSAAAACINTPVTLTNASSPLYSSRFYNVRKFNNYFYGIQDSTFLWTLPSGQQYTTNTSVNSASAGTVNAKLKATLVSWLGDKCTDSLTKSVTFNPLQNATFSFTGGNTFCSGSANPVPTTSVAGTFSGSNGLSFVSTTTGEIDLDNTADGTYTVTFTTGGTCTGTSSQTITVTSAPEAGFSYDNTAYCVGGTNPLPILDANAGSGTFSATTGLAINGTTGEINLAASIAGTYTVTNEIAASGVCAAATATFDVTVNALPVITFQSTDVCADVASVTLSATPAGGQFTGTGVTGSTFATSAGTQTVTYDYTDANGCSNTATATVTVNQLPVLTFAPVTVCSGTPTVTLSATPAGGNFTGTGVTGSTFATSAGTQTVTYTYTAATGCTNSTTATVTVNTTPAVTYTAPGTVCVYGADFSLSAGTPAGGTFSGTGVNSGNFSPATAGTGTHTITYSVTQNGCTGTAGSDIVVSACLSVEDLMAAGNVAIYPNPASDRVTFGFSNTSVSHVNVSILTVEGKTVYQNQFQSNQGTIDVTGFARGTYFVRIQADGKETTGKLILN